MRSPQRVAPRLWENRVVHAAGEALPPSLGAAPLSFLFQRGVVPLISAASQRSTSWVVVLGSLVEQTLNGTDLTSPGTVVLQDGATLARLRFGSELKRQEVLMDWPQQGGIVELEGAVVEVDALPLIAGVGTDVMQVGIQGPAWSVYAMPRAGLPQRRGWWLSAERLVTTVPGLGSGKNLEIPPLAKNLLVMMPVTGVAAGIQLRFSGRNPAFPLAEYLQPIGQRFATWPVPPLASVLTVDTDTALTPTPAYLRWELDL